MQKVFLNDNDLSIDDVVDIARGKKLLALDEKQIEKIQKSREYVEKIVAEGKAVYGINTGFGKFSDLVIGEEDVAELQKNLIRSHACGVGKALSEELTCIVMILRANALSKGNSGVRPIVIHTLINMVNKGIRPIIPEKGSLGSSGDLAPLSDMALVMMGEGHAYYKGKKYTGFGALKEAGLTPISLKAKEGLALINGTQVQTAFAVLTCYNAIRLRKLANISSAMTLEALHGITDAFNKNVHQIRKQKGQIEVAKSLLEILDGSEYTTKQGELRVQDAYALRCIPQIHGPSFEAIDYVTDIITKELNAVTDNPLIFEKDNMVISGGNFHGQPVALAMDFMSIALSELANVSERRIERLVNPALNNGLPAFLSKNGGLESGFMIMQYSAAALVSENKSLAHPASVDSIPSSANQEDHVSMGTIAARKAYQILHNLAYVLAIELISSAQAIDLREKKRQGRITYLAYMEIRKYVEFLSKDRVMNKDIEEIYNLLIKGEFLEALLDNYAKEER